MACRSAEAEAHEVQVCRVQACGGAGMRSARHAECRRVAHRSVEVQVHEVQGFHHLRKNCQAVVLLNTSPALVTSDRMALMMRVLSSRG